MAGGTFPLWCDWWTGVNNLLSMGRMPAGGESPQACDLQAGLGKCLLTGSFLFLLNMEKHTVLVY